MGRNLKRQIFIIRTQLNVAYSNYFVNRAFKSTADNRYPPSKYVRAGVIMAVLLVSASLFGSSVFIGKSSAKISRIEKASLATSATDLPAEVSSIPAIPAPEELADLTAPPEPELEPRYAVVVEKASKSLFVLKDTGEVYEVVKKFDVSLGEIFGAKELEGDRKTPEGVYKVVAIKLDRELPSIYGPRAFVLNYPNNHDQAMGRTGSGIWLHGSGQGKKTPDTKGCVELDDDGIIALDEFLKEETIVAIYGKAFKLPIVDGKIRKNFIGAEFFYGDHKGINAG